MIATASDLIEAAVLGYVECGLWLALNGETMEPDDSADASDLTPDAESRVREDVTSFILGNAGDCLAYCRPGRGHGRISDAAGHLGHDFYLTRNGHGAGFWDRGLGDLGDRLTGASEPYGEQTFVVGANGEVDLA